MPDIFGLRQRPDGEAIPRMRDRAPSVFRGRHGARARRKLRQERHVYSHGVVAGPSSSVRSGMFQVSSARWPADVQFADRTMPLPMNLWMYTLKTNDLRISGSL